MRDKFKQNILNAWGEFSQVNMLEEELLELALCLVRLYRGRSSREDIIEEIADVELMIEQVKFIFGIKKEDIDHIKNYKLNRLKQRLEDHNEDNRRTNNNQEE